MSSSLTFTLMYRRMNGDSSPSYSCFYTSARTDGARSTRDFSNCKRASVDLDARGFDELRVLGDILPDERGEVGGRAAEHVYALHLEAFGHVG